MIKRLFDYLFMNTGLLIKIILQIIKVIIHLALITEINKPSLSVETVNIQEFPNRK